MKNLTERYLETSKGRKIIAALMLVPIKLCRPIYRDGKTYHEIDGKLLDQDQVVQWKQEQQKLARQKAMLAFNLTEDDMMLSEEKLEKIRQDEIRNIGFFGSSEDVGDVKQSIDALMPKMREIPLG